MLEGFSGNAIAAKARAIYGKRLTTANYTDLLRQSSVNDVCAYLKSNTDYGKYMKSINEVSIHRGQLEAVLNRSRIEKYFSLCHFDFSRNKGFYRYVISSIEVHLILKSIMLLNSNNNESEEIIAELPPFLQDYTSFDFKGLAKIKTFDELLEILRNTPYYEAIKIFNAPCGQINLSDCELSLKTIYYKNMFANIDKYYKGKVKLELKETILIEIELMNLSLIYRLTRYFKKSPAEIKRRLLPFHYKLNEKALDALLQEQTKEDFIKKMRLSVYDNNMANVEFYYVEDYTKRLRYILNKKMMRFSSSAPICFYSLMTLLQIEIENITIIIESIRYDENGDLAQKLLVLE